MADINFSASEVSNTLKKVTETYTKLEEKIKTMSEKSVKIDNFWDSSEKEKFVVAVNNLFDMIDKFNNKYAGFLALIDSTIKTYNADKDSILTALEKELSKSQEA